MMKRDKDRKCLGIVNKQMSPVTIVTVSYQFFLGRISPIYLLSHKLLLTFGSLAQVPFLRNLLWSLLAHSELINTPSLEVLQGAGYPTSHCTLYSGFAYLFPPQTLTPVRQQPCSSHLKSSALTSVPGSGFESK